MKKVLITGVSGFLGEYLVATAPENMVLLGVYHNKKVHFDGVRTQQLDLLNFGQTQALIETFQPDAIIHAAALSNPNYCELHPEAAHKVNVEATQKLVKIAAQLDIPFVFTSSDLVFDGTQPPYNEQSPLNPPSLYGRQKQEAEAMIQAIHPAAIIARLPLMYGFPKYGQNFLSNWVAKLKGGEVVHAFTDEYRTAASGRCVSNGIWLLLERQVKGIWHLGSKERLSRYDFAVNVATHLGLDTSLIIPSKQADVKMAAKRPADVSLDSQRAFDIGYEPLSLKSYLESVT